MSAVRRRDNDVSRYSLARLQSAVQSTVQTRIRLSSSLGCCALRSGEADLAQEQQTAASAEAERLQASVADVRVSVEIAVPT